MSKILVTGAAGYIGRHVVSTLVDMGENVIACDLRDDGVDPRASFCNYPIFNKHEDIFTSLGSPDICIHLAWRNGFVHNAASHMEELSDHIIFCNNMMKGGLKKLSVMGSMHEIGYWEGAIDENTPCNPLSQYGIAKNALRQSLMLQQKENQCSLRWLRAYYITGDDEKNNSIFSKITQAVKNGKTEFPFTTGKNKYDFIDVDELAKMIATASIQDEEDGIINICSGTPISLADRVEQFIAEKNYNIKLIYGAFPDRAYDSPATWGDASKIKKIMGY